LQVPWLENWGGARASGVLGVSCGPILRVMHLFSK